MGLLNKLKNVLFEEEEIEVKEVESEQEFSRSTMELPKINRKAKKESYNFEEETDKELFEAEKTFDFPAFDEEEFKEMVPNVKEETILVPFDSEEKKEEIKKERVEVEEKVERRQTPSYNTSRKSDYTSTRILRTTPTTTEPPRKIFKPSPVISPVYGILDKNYKKEDIVTRDEINEKKNITLDVDSVRKKAFGTLEEDLANTLAEPVEKFYEEIKEPEVLEPETTITEEIEDVQIVEDIIEEDNIDLELNDLLEDTVDIEIDVTKEMEIPSRVSKYEEIEELDETNDEVYEELEAVPEEVGVEEVEDGVSDDTLENDLFDLIDSMYENKEDED